MDTENIYLADYLLCTRNSSDATLYLLSDVSQPEDFGPVMGRIDQGVNGRIILEWILKTWDG
jgi:hypothetical protein